MYSMPQKNICENELNERTPQTTCVWLKCIKNPVMRKKRKNEEPLVWLATSHYVIHRFQTKEVESMVNNRELTPTRRPE
jgi:hypothetical protein